MGHVAPRVIKNTYKNYRNRIKPSVYTDRIGIEKHAVCIITRLPVLTPMNSTLLPPQSADCAYNSLIPIDEFTDGRVEVYNTNFEQFIKWRTHQRLNAPQNQTEHIVRLFVKRFSPRPPILPAAPYTREGWAAGQLK